MCRRGRSGVPPPERSRGTSLPSSIEPAQHGVGARGLSERSFNSDSARLRIGRAAFARDQHFRQRRRWRRRDRDAGTPPATPARVPDRPCGWRSPIRAWRRTRRRLPIRSRMSRPRARSSGLSDVTSRRPSSTRRSPLLSSFAGLATARSAQYRAATGSRFTVSPRSSRHRQHLGWQRDARVRPPCAAPGRPRRAVTSGTLSRSPRSQDL